MRRLPLPQIAAFVICGLVTASTPLSAQQGRARVENASSAPGNSAAAAREPRPDGESLHVEKVSPELEELLQRWYRRTSGIEKLKGTHTRYVYEQTFFSGSVATGEFFYKAPDKGRIDIEPTSTKDVDPETEGVQIRDVAGNIYNYKECPEESWICDGKRVIEVKHGEKTFEVLPIPPEHQGANIMDGPLPFLFGLPPEKAKLRYHMKLDEQMGKGNTHYLIVKPRRKTDKNNWSVAHVMLRKDNYLPHAVKLVAPEGIKSTVYVFNDYQVNDFSILEIFGVTPFRPPPTYAQVQNDVPKPVQPLRRNGKPVKGVPSVEGLKFEDARNVLGRRGYRELQVIPTRTACKPEMKHIVKDQSPKAGAEVSKEQTIQVILYATQEDIDRWKKQHPNGHSQK